jgi:hypothetical protein
MSAYASSQSLTGQSPVHGNDQSVGGRLIRFVIAGQQRKADRRILMYLPNVDSYRQEFGTELERRLMGQ